MHRTRTGGQRAAGFSLFELLLVILLVALAVVPMVTAFGPARGTAPQDERQTVLSNRARATLNRVVGLGYAALAARQTNNVSLALLFGSAAEAAREDVSVGGETLTPAVSIQDASDGSGGLLEIAVTLDTVELRTRLAQR
jgi:type II secretory pathway pseudopilin PulG